MGIDERTRARFVAGDPLRAIAALGVLFGHTFSYALIATGHPELIGQAVPGIDWLQWPVQAGPQLVYLFFALSGYLIGRPFIRAFVDGTHYPSPVRYVKHRILRIVPAYWVVLTICLIVIALPAKPLGPILEAYFFLLDWYQSPIEGALPQAWTLRVEMRFYLLLPIVAAIAVWIAGKAGPRLGRTARCWIVIVLAAAWGVGCSFITDGDGAFVSGGGLIYTAFAFAPGLILAAVELLPLRKGLLENRVAAYVAALGVLFAASLWLYPWWTILYTSALEFQIRQMILLTLIFGGLLFWQWSGRKTWKVLDNPVLRWTGSRSYGIYLLHLLILSQIFDEFAQGDGYKRTFAVLLPVTLILTGLAAEVLYRLVEKPALSLKDVPVRKWFRKERSP